MPTESTLDSQPDIRSRPSWIDAVEHASVIAVAVFWGAPFTRAVGGRGVHSELLFAIVLIVAALAARAWRAPIGSILTSAAVATVAVAVCLFAPTGWYGSDVAAGYAISAASYVIARRYARDVDRRFLIAAVVCLAGLYEFSQAALAWWGSEDPSTEMSGTFYWHNPYAAFLLPGAVVALGLVASRRSPWHLIGWVTAPVCTAGIVFSTSRATAAALVVAWLIVLCAARTRVAFVRVLGVVFLSIAVTFALPGPPFFPHYTSPLSIINERAAAGETLSQNGAYRVEFWKEALQVAKHHPVSGGGYHSLATASAYYTPSGWARSQLAHNGYLQAFSDGGLLLGLPFLFAILIVVVWSLRRAWALVAHGPGRVEELLTGTVAVALLAAFAHSAIDFDWSHPAILVEVALLAACVAPDRDRQTQSRRLRWLAGAGLAVLLGVLAVLVPALQRWQLDTPSSLASPAVMLSDAQAPFGDNRPARQVLQDESLGLQPVSDAEATQALALTREASTVDLHLALLREAVAAQIGSNPDAVARARGLLTHVDGSTAPYLPDLATVMIASGDDAAARAALKPDLASQVAHGIAEPDLSLELSLWAQHLGRGNVYSCSLQFARQVLGKLAVQELPRPLSNCPAGPR